MSEDFPNNDEMVVESSNTEKYIEVHEHLVHHEALGLAARDAFIAYAKAAREYLESHIGGGVIKGRWKVRLSAAFNIGHGETEITCIAGPYYEDSVDTNDLNASLRRAIDNEYFKHTNKPLALPRA